MQRNHDYDVIIIGARIGGSVLASFLGDAGYRVLMVDRTGFPSPTLSSHFFRGYGMVSVLNRLGLLEEVLALGAPPLIRQYFYTQGSSEPNVEPPQKPGDIGYCLSVRREPLDDLLVKRACASSTVTLCEHTCLKGLLFKGKRAVGVRLSDASGDWSAHARIIVGADGRHSSVAKMVETTFEEWAPPYRGTFYRYLSGFKGYYGIQDGPEFSLLEDEIVFVLPSDGAVTCVAISVNLNDFAWMQSKTDERFRTKISNHRGIAERFAAATPAGGIFRCQPEPSWVRVPKGFGWALVGDSGLHIDPWAGEGIDLASTHAMFLAEEIIDWFKGSISEKEALQMYHLRRSEHAMATYQNSVGLAPDFRQWNRQTGVAKSHI